MKKLAPILCVAWMLPFIFLGCQNLNKQKNSASGNGFYYWKTTLDFSKKDKALADSLGLKKCYLRYFDVDWSPTLEMPVPVGVLQQGWDKSWVWESQPVYLTEYQVVPVIYLTNRVFSHDVRPDSLAAKISRKIQEITEGYQWSLYPGWNNDFENAEVSNWETLDSLRETLQKRFLMRMSEIQIDCDWTPSTRERYFDFLKAMKKANPGLAISCTVRLHQFRDREQAGIPPVDRATLMCYNMAPPKDFSTADAIFDPALVGGYLKNGSYPLSLEAALPLFSWGALFHENQFKGLAGGLSEAGVRNNPLFEPAGDGHYRFTQDTVFAEIYMREGDLLRLDGPSPAELTAVAARLSSIGAVKSLSFFDWNPDKIREYHVDEIFKKFGK